MLMLRISKWRSKKDSASPKGTKVYRLRLSAANQIIMDINDITYKINGAVMK
uniref:Uncharacterized protein n=1 Tax=uncultured Desulfobacterium sp. TaxID=201089 RepID=E1YJH0_9BACT|nr:unknown protein [uncultured Desulfobacterium sp.]